MAHSQSYRRILHKMGYYEYQQGLIYHHLNEEGGWDSHLNHCREFILKAIDKIKPSRISVLGSGWLLDLPLAEITGTVEKIFLVDIIHPPEVISQVSVFKNVELIEQDITGGLIQEVWNKVRKHTFLNPLKSLDEIVVSEYIPAYDPGMVLSLNILTQIEALPVKFIRRHSRLEDNIITTFCSLIQEKHIGFLKRYHSVLITDTSELITNKAGEVTEKRTLLMDLPESGLKEEWTWNFDLVRSDFYQQKSAFKVIALIL